MWNLQTEKLINTCFRTSKNSFIRNCIEFYYFNLILKIILRGSLVENKNED